MVVGGGVSGLALAWKAAQDGKQALVLEQEKRAGGCLHSERTAAGYWFEMGAHTTYNSYGSFLDIAVGTRVIDGITERGPARASFGLLRDGQWRFLTPPKVLLELSWLEAALHFPRGILASKEGQTVYSYYAGLLGKRNYDRVMGPFLSAVPSQAADGFPLTGPGSLFKKRERRKEFIKSHGFKGGLQSVCDGAAAAKGVTTELGVKVAKLIRTADGLEVRTADGRAFSAPNVALAVPPSEAAALLREPFPELSAQIARIKTVAVDSVGVVLPKEKAWPPPCAFLVPVDDTFFSCVTRDPFPDEKWRAFAFHFKPGQTREARLKRIAEVLKVQPSDFAHLAEAQRVLPAPALGHGAIVADIDRCLAGQKLLLTGNFFEGLAIEDCVLRSNAEWARAKAGK